MFIHSQNKQPASVPLGATGQRMREHNLAMVLRMIWDESETGISRAELARRTGLSRSTISGLTADLLDDGLVLEARVARTAKGGRPPVLLRFCDDRFVVVGVEIGSSHVSCVRTDLRGHLEHHHEAPAEVQDDPARTLGLVHDLVGAALAGADRARRPVGIGVAVPSPLDANAPGRLSGRILPAWADVDLGAELYMHHELPILIDNDANLGALAEAWWGAGRGVPQFTYVKVGTGVGAGHIVDSEIFRGSSGIAGEIGHSVVARSDRACRCGLSGCLEAEIGTEALLAKARERLQGDVATSLVDDDSLTLPSLVAAARRGDPVAADVVTEAGRYLGFALANLANLVNPSRIILGGSVSSAGDLLLRPARQAMAERALGSHVDGAEVRVSELHPGAIARGAATLVIQWCLDQVDVLTPTEPSGQSRASTRLLSTQPTLR